MEELLNKFSSFIEKIDELEFPKDDLIEINAYGMPFLHSTDLVNIPKRTYDKLMKYKDYIPSDIDSERINDIIYSLDRSENNFSRINHSNSGYATEAVIAYVISVLYIDSIVNDIFSFDRLEDNKLLPKKILRRLSVYNQKIDEISEETENIESKINIINDAYNAAEFLPTTMTTLKNANDDIIKISEDIDNKKQKIDEALIKTNSHEKEIENISNKLSAFFEEKKVEYDKKFDNYINEADKYINECEKAFRMTTTKGLSWSFQEKANKLNWSIRLWVLSLATSLFIAGFIGYYRFLALDAFFLKDNTSTFQTIVQILISIFSIGTPLWFSWLATKQIGQRFKLAEDYEFKASISKAYEGYRREALQLEEDFSQRLFSNALTRLEEPPIRFMSKDIHSSPISEILSSELFISKIKEGGESVDIFLKKTGLKKTKSNKEKEKLQPDTYTEEQEKND